MPISGKSPFVPLYKRGIEGDCKGLFLLTFLEISLVKNFVRQPSPRVVDSLFRQAVLWLEVAQTRGELIEGQRCLTYDTKSGHILVLVKSPFVPLYKSGIEADSKGLFLLIFPEICLVKKLMTICLIP